MSDVFLEFDISGKIARELRPKAELIVKKAAREIEREEKRSMSGPKSGRMYKKSKSGKPHQASAPGEPPARDTGNLANSIQVTMLNDVTAAVDVSAEYAETLEFGGAHVESRPFVEPAIKLVQPEFEAALKTLLPK